MASWRAGCPVNGHVRFGGRPEETGWSQSQHRASGRPYWGEGPRLGDRRTSPWCAWLAWSRFRVVIPVLDRTIPTVAACLDATFRAFGGVPTYCLTGNEKTVTTAHIANIAVRNPDIVPIGRFYGTVIGTCMPADPASKGGVEKR
ncbi:transposase family protein [Catenulispora acidiphila]|uniref:transposase family protein n=1 Tax=Catenulispora acidiphila TaxID=304895 RepID=UPI001180120F|nr:transposase family protein [Catenulispora acidiphila]